MLINDIGNFFYVCFKECRLQNLLERNVASILATKTYYHKPPCWYNSPLR